jgi:hypothetical protein
MRNSSTVSDSNGEDVNNNILTEAKIKRVMPSSQGHLYLHNRRWVLIKKLVWGVYRSSVDILVPIGYLYS